MYVIDTNVISELLLAEPAPSVAAWLDAQDKQQIFLTAINEAELHYGTSIMPFGKRRIGLEAAISRWLDLGFKDRILPFDRSSTRVYAEIAANRKRAGRPIKELDCQIAAICRTYDATLVTRNVRDFEDSGVEFLDPWVAER